MGTVMKHREKCQMDKSFTIHTDPGHGWLEVTHRDLEDVGLHPSQFAGYSYCDKGKYYLEEDCHAYEFMKAYEKKYGKLPECVDEYMEDTFVLKLARI